MRRLELDDLEGGRWGKGGGGGLEGLEFTPHLKRVGKRVGKRGIAW